jgi:hypothetical protein
MPEKYHAILYGMIALLHMSCRRNKLKDMLGSVNRVGLISYF